MSYLFFKTLLKHLCSHWCISKPTLPWLLHAGCLPFLLQASSQPSPTLLCASQGCPLWIESLGLPYPLVSSWVWPMRGSSRREWEKNEFEVFIPLDSLPARPLVGSGFVLTFLPPSAKFSQGPETTPSLAPSCLRMIRALSSQVFHQPLLGIFTLLCCVIIPASPQSHCWSVPGDNWYSQHATFSLHYSIFPNGSYLPIAWLLSQ